MRLERGRLLRFDPVGVAYFLIVILYKYLTLLGSEFPKILKNFKNSLFTIHYSLLNIDQIN
jgi:hypothetical protein